MNATTGTQERILVIRLGALGDLVLCFAAFQAIRNAHPNAHIALLTMPAFAVFARQMPWFNEVIIDERARALNIGNWLSLRQRLKAFNPTRVYDLQGKFRQTLVYALLGGPFKQLGSPEWSGAAPLCLYPRQWPPTPGMHFTDFIAAQLRVAGIRDIPAPQLDWLTDAVGAFNLPPDFALLIPGCGPGRDYKRWPAAGYAALARELAKRNIAVVAIGTGADASALAALKKLHPATVDLGGRTSLAQLAAIARAALAVVGNDTGPTHLAAAVGAPTLTLFSAQVNPVWSAPKGARTSFLQGKPLAELLTPQVLLALDKLLDKSP